MFIKRKRKMTEEEKAREIAKAREKQRKKMIRTRYGQKQKKHARQGVRSCVLAAVTIFLLGWMISSSFSHRGDISVLFGVVGLLVAVISGRGLQFAIKGFKERDKNYITCKIGAGINGVLLICMCAIFIGGLF